MWHDRMRGQLSNKDSRKYDMFMKNRVDKEYIFLFMNSLSDSMFTKLFKPFFNFGGLGYQSGKNVSFYHELAASILMVRGTKVSE